MAWGYEPKKCKYEHCHKEVKQSQAGGRVKEYCDSTCRSGQHRLETERAEQRRIAEANERRFLEAVAGAPKELYPDLRRLAERYSLAFVQQVAEMCQQAHALGVQSLQRSDGSVAIKQRNAAALKV